MRVLHVTSGNLYGGIENLLVTLARHRDRSDGMETQFAVCFEGRLADELRTTGVSVHRLGEARLRNPSSVIGARRSLATILSKQEFDAAVCHSAWPHLLFGSVVTSAAIPLVIWQHAPVSGSWLDRLAALTRPKLLIANSRYTADSSRARLGTIPFEVVYPPVEGMDRREPGDARHRLRGQLGVSDDTIVIVQVSRMESWKGHALHLEALSRLRPAPNWECWIVGGSQRPAERQYEEGIKTLAGDLGVGDRVRFLGQRDDVPDLLAAADIHCQPNSGPEPFGITFVEALAAGLPVVTTDLGGAIEIVDASCGILVRPSDPVALAEALQRLIDDPEPRARLGAAGPARAKSLCDPASQLSRLSAALSRVASGRDN